MKKSIKDFQAFKIANPKAIKGGVPVYVAAGNVTHVYDCHPAHDGSGNTHCVYIATIQGQIA